MKAVHVKILRSGRDKEYCQQPDMTSVPLEESSFLEVTCKVIPRVLCSPSANYAAFTTARYCTLVYTK
jgi:hypothetical protein